MALCVLVAVGFACYIGNPKSADQRTWEAEFYLGKAISALCFFSAWRLGGSPDLSKAPADTH